ncbi:MAG: hypothetical protein AB7G62_15100 [Magnetospirillum sp.]
MTAWTRVLRELGLEGVHTFHNTKASFVTAVAPAVTQQLARHKDYRTTERYLKVNDVAARAAVDAAAIRVNAPTHGQKVPDRITSAGKGKAASPKAAAFLENLVGAAGFEPTTPSPPD